MKNTAPLGPSPTPPLAQPPGGGLDPARLRVLRLVVGWPEQAPPTVADLAGAVGGHPNTTRHHLRALVVADLVREQPAGQAGGRGRPAARFRATVDGRAAAAADGAAGTAAAQEYVALAAAFAERLAARDGDPGADARAIGAAWGEGLAARNDGEVDGEERGPGERVIGLLDRLGFSPAVEPGAGPAVDPKAEPAADPVAEPAADPGAEPGQGTTVLLRTCPLLDAATRHPEVVCQVHLGLVAGALRAHDAPVEGLSLVPFARPGACELGLPPTLVG